MCRGRSHSQICLVVIRIFQAVFCSQFVSLMFRGDSACYTAHDLVSKTAMSHCKRWSVNHWIDPEFDLTKSCPIVKYQFVLAAFGLLYGVIAIILRCQNCIKNRETGSRAPATHSFQLYFNFSAVGVWLVIGIAEALYASCSFCDLCGTEAQGVPSCTNQYVGLWIGSSVCAFIVCLLFVLDIMVTIRERKKENCVEIGMTNVGESNRYVRKNRY